MKFNESTLRLYAEPLSNTENEKCLRAIEAIRDALKDLGFTDDRKPISLLESNTLAYSITMRNMYSADKIRIFIQGSYANNTCVRGESDVDIAVVCENQYEYAFGSKFNPHSYNKIQEGKVFKNEVERILRKHFPGYVQRKNKSIKVDGNTYRKQADTVPCFSMHYFNRSDYGNCMDYIDGVTIYADDGTIISNFPKQHIANGKAKNNRTNHYYKKMVRIIKKIRYLMCDKYECANQVSSFGLESLLWNLPDEIFTKYTTYRYIFDDIVSYLHRNKVLLSLYKEANGIKLLCPTAEDVKKYEYFIDSLKNFYEYDI